MAICFLSIHRSIHCWTKDVVMPRMSGPELAIRVKPLHPEMKVIYMSGYADNMVVHRGILGEGTGYIQKLFTVDSLARKVREILNES